MRKSLNSILLSLTIVTTICSLYLGCGGSDKSGSRPPFLSRGPYLCSVTQNSIVVAWTTLDSSNSVIQFGNVPVYESSVMDAAISKQHFITLTGLNANRQYHYRVIAGSDTSADFAFWTAPVPATPFVFVAYGDTRSNHLAHVRVLRQIFKTSPRFIINTGDLVASNTESNWNNYFADLCDSTSVGQTIPIFSTPGNHESGAMYYENLRLPHNNPLNTEEYYSFDYGSLHVISANSQINYDKKSEQYQWLVRDLESLAARKATFKIVFWHKPPYCSGTNHGSDMELRRTLATLMEAHGVDIVFNGHEHLYERTRPIKNTTFIVTGGGGAPLYDFGALRDWTAEREKVHHLCLVSVEGTILRMSMIRDDGSTGDLFIIDKNPQISKRAGSK